MAEVNARYELSHRYNTRPKHASDFIHAIIGADCEVVFWFSRTSASPSSLARGGHHCQAD
jgi:hypothetical protein